MKILVGKKICISNLYIKTNGLSFDLDIDQEINGIPFNIQKEEKGFSIYNLWLDISENTQEIIDNIVETLKNNVNSQIKKNTKIFESITI